MEKIRISVIDAKFGKPNDKGVCTPFWAVTFEDGRKATAWDEQIASYLMNDVGIGGECNIELKQKDQFTNIRAVDMTSAVKGGYTVMDAKDVSISNINQPNPQGFTKNSDYKPSRENSIVCQCLLKIAGEAALGCYSKDGTDDYGKKLCDCLTELVGAYKLGLTLLD